MRIKFEHTGTHVHNGGFLKIRLDYIPEPGEKSYSLHKISASQINPCLCQFVTIKGDETLAELVDYLQSVLSSEIIGQIDETMILPDSAHLIQPLMSEKSAMTNQPIVSQPDIKDINSRFSPLSLVIKKGKALSLDGQSIDVGETADDIRSTGFVAGYTIFGLDNPANATGTITTVEIQARVSGAAPDLLNTVVGNFYLVSGTTYKCRASEAIGTVTAGSKQTFTPVSIAIETDDYIGCYYTAGTGGVCRDTTGFAGVRYKSGEYIDADDETTYSLAAGDAISLYGTGTESGGGWAGEYCGVAVSEFDGVVPAEIDGV